MQNLSEYKRFVSYIYEYHENEKSKNCGFSRVEVRNHQCRLEIHMKLPSYPFTPVFQVYAFVPSDGQLLGISLGNASYNHGAVYGSFTIPDHEIGGLPYSIDDLGGIYVRTDGNQIFATAWKEIKIQPELFIIPNTQPQVQAASLENQPAADSFVPEISRDFPVPEKTEESLSEIPTEIPSKTLSEIPNNMRPIDPWQEIQDTYPHVQPFFDDTIHQCVQLSLKDIPRICQLGIPIGTNQFLLHSCQSYQHFVLGKSQESGTEEYVLAIPGIYDEKEQFLAAMFGFPNFKPSRNAAIRPGQFGYWYRILY